MDAPRGAVDGPDRRDAGDSLSVRRLEFGRVGGGDQGRGGSGELGAQAPFVRDGWLWGRELRSELRAEEGEASAEVCGARSRNRGVKRSAGMDRYGSA